MAKNPASIVLASSRPSTLKKRFSDIGNIGRVFPLAKVYPIGERRTRSAVCTSPGLRSLWFCLGQGASLGEEAVLADSGRTDEVDVGVGWVRRMACSRLAKNGDRRGAP